MHKYKIYILIWILAILALSLAKRSDAYDTYGNMSIAFKKEHILITFELSEAPISSVKDKKENENLKLDSLLGQLKFNQNIFSFSREAGCKKIKVTSRLINSKKIELKWLFHCERPAAIETIETNIFSFIRIESINVITNIGIQKNIDPGNASIEIHNS